MRTKPIRYRLLLCLLLLTGASPMLPAQDYKDQIGMEVQMLTDKPGAAGPVVVYNSTTGNYLVLYAAADPGCATSYDLFGRIVSGTTGATVGGEVFIARGDNTCGTHQIVQMAAAHDPGRNRFLVFFVAQDNNGGGSLRYVMIDGSTLQPQFTGPVMDQDLLNPYQHVICSYNSGSDNFTLGYHKNRGTGEGQLYLRFANAGTGALSTTTRTIAGSDFAAGTLGVHRSAMISIPDAEKNYLVYEVAFSDGSEIWCSQVDTRQQSFIDTPFRVSADGSPAARYKNPALSYDTDQNQLLVVYEKAQNEGVLYSLASRIHAQAIACSNNSLLQPINFELSQLPFVPTCITCGEQVKRPVAAYSPISKEHFVAFYGIRPASQEDLYDVMGHRIDATTLEKIEQDSYRIALQKGTSIAVNKTLRTPGMAHNPVTNQFLLGWYDETNAVIETQIRRLENNAPLDIVLSATNIGENTPQGTEIGDIATVDPDPDDSHTYTLENLTGKDDARFFDIIDGQLAVRSPLNYEEAPERTFLIRSVDSKNEYFEKTVLITVEDRNDIPDSVRLSNRSVPENGNASSLVGTLAVYDQDQSDTHTLQLTSQTDKFELQGNQLYTRIALDHEAAPTVDVGIRCRDDQGGVLNTSVRVDITDVNEPPTGFSLAQDGFFENRSPGSQSIALLAEDEDAGDQHTFTLVSGVGAEDNASFRVANGDKLQATINLDFEQKSSYSIRLRTTDKGQLIYEGPMAVHVVNVNEPPGNLSLSNNIVEEAMPAGTVIGRLSVTDPDGDTDTHRYTMEQGAPDLFVEENGTVKTNNIFTFVPDQPQSNRRNLTVRATDEGGLSVAKSFIIEIIERQDHQPPLIIDLDNSDRFDDSNPSKILDITVADDDRVDSVVFYYKGITEDVWKHDVFTDIQQSGADMSYATLQVQISKLSMDEMGMSYRFRVIDPSGNDTLSELRHIYRLVRNKHIYPIHNAPFNGKITTYRMMAMPYDVSALAIEQWLGSEENLGAYDPSKWRMFHFSNQKNGYEEYPAFSRLQPGKGYWFNASARVQATLDSAVASAYNEENLCTIEMRAGWNQIGNPYPIDLSWEDILEYNKLSDIPLYLYQSGYVKSGILPAFSGGLVYVTQSTDITVPFARPTTSGRIGGFPGAAPLDADSWQVDLALHNGEISYQVGGFGMAPEASPGQDRYDEPLLPRFIEYADYSFFPSDGNAGVLSRDIVPTSSNHVWEFTTECNTGRVISQLSWDNTAFGNNPYQLILYDVSTGQAVDMRKATSYSYEADGARDFRILYGNRTLVESMLGQADIQVAHPYPNPFENDFILPLNLPLSNRGYTADIRFTSASGTVVLDRTLKLDRQGQTELRWSDITGETDDIRAGIYIYTISIQNGNHVIHKHGKLVKH